MNSGDEVVSPATDGPVPLPRAAGPGLVPVPAPILSIQTTPPSALSPETIIRWIRAAGGRPWFPSAHAKETGVPRDSLDEPLNELRQAGLVRVADWVRGAGQGFVLTDDGEAMVTGEADRPTPEKPAGEPVVPADAHPSVVDLRPPIITPALLLANLIWFFVGVVVASRLGVPIGSFLWKSDLAVLSKLGAVSAPDLLRGEWWRLATACFVHVGIAHLVVNLIALGTAGPLAELLWGRWRLAVVYAASGLAGSCLAMALNPVSSTGVITVLAGASGAIWGVMTSLLAWLLLFRTRLPPALVADWFRRLGFVFVLNAAFSLVPGISWQAHLGGAVAGFVSAALLNVLRFSDRPRRVLAVLLLAVLPVLCVGGLIAAMKSGDSWVSLRLTPLLGALQTEAVQPVEGEAARFLVLTPARRAPERTAELRGKVESLYGKAVEAAALLGHSNGSADAESRREKLKACAVARAQSFGLLLAMLDANAIPEVAAWKSWGDSRREANSLWAESAQSGSPKPAPAVVVPRGEPAPGPDQ